MVSHQQLSGFPDTTYKNTTPLWLKPEVIIGRDIRSDIVLPSSVVSRKHAACYYSEQNYLLVDLGSTNGTFVNGIQISKPHTLQIGDFIQIGPYQLIFDENSLSLYEISKGLRLEAISLRKEVGRGKKRTCILDEISLSVLPGEFIALVGGSGAGKTTLLQALCGINQAQGQVLINGTDLYNHFDLFRSIIGFVPQDDIIHRELTVYSALRYAALLRLPPDTTAEEIETRIDQVLSEVDMIGQKNQVINSLSGGQRKRASISVELLVQPRLFFLDEPTTGLDPWLEKKMMTSMRNLADGGQTIILVTHATANITQCDHVCFLSHGQLIYFGPPLEAFKFFGISKENSNFSDIYGIMDDPDPKNAKIKASNMAKHFKMSDEFMRYVKNRQLHQQGMILSSEYGTSLTSDLRTEEQGFPSKKLVKQPNVSSIRQFLILSRRYLEIIRRDKLLLTVLTIIMPIIGLLLILISEPNWLIGMNNAEIDNKLFLELEQALEEGERMAFYSIVGSSQTLIFILALASVLFGLFASSYEFVKERSIYLRERMVFLRIFPYLASKAVILGGFAIFQCFLLLTVIRFKIEFPSKGVIGLSYLEMVITLTLGAIAAIFLGLLISSLAPNSNAVIYVILGVLFFQIIFAGVIFELPSTYGPIISGLTMSRWTIEGLGSTINMGRLNELSKIRYDAASITQEVPIEMEKPDPNNPSVLMKEIFNESVTIDPEPVDITNQREFYINYDSTTSHLWSVWLILILISIIFAIETLIILRLKDVIY